MFVLIRRSEYKNFLRDFYDVQTQTYENSGQGWMHWTWKTESAADWSYQAGIAGGWIPANAADHRSPISTLCGQR